MKLIQPLASFGVRRLAALGVNPLFIVLSHGILGLIAASLLMTKPSGYLLSAALLLQGKTLLDNMDGGLARATGQITQMGRYFDTGIDFLVNIALFIALSFYGPPLLSVLAFACLSFILSLDYNTERLYKTERETHMSHSDFPIGAPFALFTPFKGLYTLLFTPQDKGIEFLNKRVLEHLSQQSFETIPKDLRLAWNDGFSTASLVNLGLSTQMFLLGVCLLIGQPFLYVYTIFIEVLYVIFIQWLRVKRFRTFLASRTKDLS